MHSERHAGGSLPSTLLFGLSAILLVICIVYAPGEAFHASGQGLSIWWRVVFPALLPFLVLTEILLASGFAHGLGVLLEPLTRKGLGLPGSYAWVLPLGLTAGFPAAASASASLYKQGKITALEAERMASTAHFGSPMLLVVVIGTGYMSRPELGLFLLAVHWLSGIAAGVTLHLLSSGTRSLRKTGSVAPKASPKPTVSRFRLAAVQMEDARRADGRSFGKLLGDAVSAGVQTLMTVGGYMIIFAVVIHVLLSALPDIIPAYSVAGALEIHLGTHAVAETAMPPAIVSALLGVFLGWSGICAYLQVRAVLKPVGLGSALFLVNRLIHGAYAYVLTLLLWRPLTRLLPGTLPANAETGYAVIRSGEGMGFPIPEWKQIAGLIQMQFSLFFLLITGILILSLITRKRSS